MSRRKYKLRLLFSLLPSSGKILKLKFYIPMYGVGVVLLVVVFVVFGENAICSSADLKKKLLVF